MKNTVASQTENRPGTLETRMLDLDLIRCDCGTQIRASINEETVEEYAEAMRNGVEFPPAVVFFDSTQYILADGFHRRLGCERAGLEQMLVEIRMGTKSDALKYALGANAQHGLKRTNTDKRHSVEMALAEWPNMSDRAISDICAVSNNLVSEMRRQLSSDDSCGKETRLGKDGKERRMPSRVPRASAASESVSVETTTESVPAETPAVVETPEEKHEAAIPPGLRELRAEVKEHLDLVFEDAKYVLGEWDSISLDRQALEDVARTQFFSAKMLSKFIKALAASANN